MKLSVTQDKTALIFDFFGTLVEYHSGSFFENQRKDTYTYLTHYGFSLDYQNFDRLINETYEALRTQAKVTANEFHMHEVIRLVLQEGFQNKVEENFVAEITEKYLIEWAKEVSMLPNIHAFLTDLADTYTLAIISNTNSPTLIPMILRQFRMEQYFSHITTSIEHGKRKPHPAIFNDTLTLLNLKPTDAIFVGDNYTADYLGAKALGIQTFLIDPQTTYPQLGNERITTLFELKKAISFTNE